MNRTLKLVFAVLLGCSFMSSPDVSFAHHKHHSRHAHPAHKQPAIVRPSNIIGKPKTPIPYTLTRTGSLEGRQVGDLYALYLGHTGVIGNTIPLNCEHQLTELWDLKLRRHPSPVARELQDSLLREYRTQDRGRMSLHEYLDRADTQSRLLYRALNWEAVGETHLRGSRGIDRRKLKDLQELVSMVNGRTLITFGNTEIMPSSDGAFNADFLDFLLRQCGRRFVESIPATHDHYASFGQFQFTSDALYEVGKTKRGASRENVALPVALRLPGSVIKLRGDQQFRAAYLNAVCNLALFVRRLDDRELATLEWAMKNKRGDVNVLIGSMHHLPGPAIKAGRRWLDAKARYPFLVSTSGGTHFYAGKTMYNYQALLRY